MGIEDCTAWDLDGRRVCASCVDDYALAAALRDEHEPEPCDFCSSTESASIGKLVDAVLAGWSHEYEPAIEHTPWDEGEYVFLGPHWDTPELVDEWGGVFRADGLADAVQDLLGFDNDPWVERDALRLRPDEAMRDAWDQFREIVRHRTRYVFWNTPQEDENEPGYVSPAQVLDRVGRLAVSLGLVRELLPTESIYRAQVEDDTATVWDAKRLGTAPLRFATKTNRMSPCGVPMFYGALDPATAAAEVRAYAGEGVVLRVGEFQSFRPVYVLDLTDLPEVPSLFDPERGGIRREVGFLHSFVKDLKARVDPGAGEIEYVPTQVMTEFFLQVFRPASTGGAGLAGIVYPSDQATGAALVLEFRNEQCFDDPSEAVAAKTAGMLLLGQSRLTPDARPARGSVRRLGGLARSVKVALDRFVKYARRAGAAWSRPYARRRGRCG
ncbi:RES domain-containing protein [Gordonia sp. JH63]|uniref:HEPN-associated N-terminal domain-containing protein n=1 Tax=Gordonia TaxID=2053 RepID=UPI00131F6684|nr:HEPN-associated N-terminal domain-containing protein [Gordonia sp. JH63]QHD87775.1 RES domain-containing protein [Gordonia sp. JH63]